LPRNILDSHERRERTLGILVEAQTRGAGAYCDDVDRVTGGVVEIACDAGALFSRREESLTLRLLFEVGDLFVSQPHSLARKPGHRPQQGRVNELESRK